MQLRIRHLTVYRYSEAVGFGRHRLVVRPREGHDVRVESLELAVSPGAEVVWTRDVFGNSVALLEFDAGVRAAELSIGADVVLTRHAAHGRRGKSAWEVPYPVVYDALESAVAAAYRATSYPDETPAVREFLAANGLLEPMVDEGAEGILDRLNGVLYRAVKYNRRPERGTQSPSETLEKGSGSCRDIATLMMEGARMLGMAARFASGYLDCAASTAGTASTHAWVEVYLPPLGWMGFDPTLGERSSNKHIACGLSNHPRGVMPVSGTYMRTEGARYLGMEVAVGIGRVSS